MKPSAYRYILLIAAVLIFPGCCTNKESVHAVPEPGVILSNGAIIPLEHTIRQVFIIGHSVQKRPLYVTRMGRGKERAIILIGCVHGEEKNTEELIRHLQGFFYINSHRIPVTYTLFFIPVMNPDGYVQGTRENAGKVDLNRNFPTEDWRADALGMHDVVPYLGGKSPGSEPEVSAVAVFLLEYIKPMYDSVWILAFHSACPPKGYIQPGYVKNGTPDPVSAAIAKKAAGVAGYWYLHSWVDKFPVTGELIHFCVMNGMTAMDVELPTYDPPHVIPKGKKESTMASMLRMIKALLVREY